MAKKKQEQQEQSQDEHVMAILDKRTNKTAVVSKMNEQDGSLEIVPPDKKNNGSFLKLDRTTPLELFFTNFKNQYENPTSFSFFLVPLVLLEKTLNAVVQIRKGEDPGAEGKKLVENSELNDEAALPNLPAGISSMNTSFRGKNSLRWGLTSNCSLTTIAWAKCSKEELPQRHFPLPRRLTVKRRIWEKPVSSVSKGKTARCN